MDFFETVKKRRSIRRFKNEPIPNEWIEKALESAVLAPNSSNTQTWDFHWIKSEKMKTKVAEICLNQSAARTASGILVITADPKNWKRSQKALIQWVNEANAPEPVKKYYSKLIPLMYQWGPFNLLGILKSILIFFAGLTRPVPRGPSTQKELQEVAIKSAALAAENFVLAITAQGGATCMMEGFDERRMKRILNLPRSSRVVMAIAFGFEAENGTWAPQFRLPLDKVLHIYN